LRLLDPSIYLGNVETGKSKKKTLVTAEADHRSESRSQGRPSGAASGGLTLGGGENGGKLFCWEDGETCDAWQFSFSCRRLFSTSSHIATARRSPAPEICKSLISWWFLYSSESCCAAPILG
jgi:hypothetical protein